VKTYAKSKLYYLLINKNLHFFIYLVPITFSNFCTQQAFEKPSCFQNIQNGSVESQPQILQKQQKQQYNIAQKQRTDFAARCLPVQGTNF
jgi:hypothetical protein